MFRRGPFACGFFNAKNGCEQHVICAKVRGAAKEWNGKRLFENASLDVSVGERVALIGRNGVGRDMTLFDFAHSARRDLHDLRRAMERIQRNLESGTDDKHVMDEYLKLIDTYTAKGGYEYELEVEMALKRLGFEASHFPVPYWR